MKNPNRKLYFKSAVTAIIAGIIFSLGLFTVYAYFSTQGKVYTADGEGSYAVFGTNLDLLFDRIDDKKVASGTDIGSGSYDPKAAWGSAQNPYVISATRHVQNLSVLQSIGYFEELFTSKGTIPHFLICNTDGTPITIDGTDVTIKPIGNSRYPFYGYVGGAFGEGTTSVGSLSSDTSALYNFTVETTEDNIDVGLFGYVGMLNENEYSALMNLLLYDVKIVVDQPTIVEQAADIVNHIFSYSNVGDVDSSTIPHENHHIGILAGHVYHTKVNNISVYYSNDDIAALDFSHTSGVTEGEAVPNYMSSTGIIGFLDHMNPDITNGSVVAGTGTSSGDISISGISGSGGGLASGTGRGYVTAAAVYEAYSKGVTDNGTGSLIIKDGVDADGNALCHEWIRNNIFGNPQNTGKYYFYDGVFTFALSEGSTDTIEDTFNMDEDNKVTDTFVLGQNDDSRWKKNVAEGNYAVVGYLNQVTDIQSLNAALSGGKSLIISHDTSTADAESAFLLTLSDVGSSNGGYSDDVYTTSGENVEYADDEVRQSILNTYNTAPDMADMPDSVKTIVETTKDAEGNATGFGNLKLLNLGSSSNEEIINQLKTRYSIDINYNQDNTLYYRFDNDDPAFVFSDMSAIRRGYIPKNYFHFTRSVREGWVATYYPTSYSYNSDTNPAEWNSSEFNTKANWHPDVANWSEDDTSDPIVVTASGDGYDPAPLLYLEGTEYYYRENKSIKVMFNPDGDPIIPEGEAITSFVICDEKNGIYQVYENGSYVGELTNVEVSLNEETGVSTYSGTLNGNERSYTSGEVIFKQQMDYYTFGAVENSNLLQLTRKDNKALGIVISRNYSIWCGPEGSLPDGATDSTTKAGVSFNADGSCYIRYRYGSTQRFLNYNTTNFNGSQNQNDSAKMYIYVLEGTSTIDYGHITWDPTDPLTEAENADVNTPAIEFASDEYVLWPDASAITSAGYTVSAPTYSVKKLSDLAGGLNGASSGWRNDHGEPLTAKDLYKKFHMASKTRFDIAINIGNFNWATGGFLRAPIGTLGTEAYIPQGAVAFRVNKPGKSKIRVIVALPQSDYSPEEEEYKLSDKDTYFGVWQVGEAGDSFLQTFDRNTAIEKFYLPKSEPYKPNSSIDECQKYTISYNGQSYRSYLNGDRILMAYEFTVDQEGVYILATDGAPMEIVYFSADGTASAGRDGSGGSVIGNIDFVYDYDGNVITVTNPGTEADGYSKYVASLCLLNTKNNTNLAETGYDFPDINEAMIKIRRYVADGESQINLKATGNDATYIDIIRYAALADKVNRK